LKYITKQKGIEKLLKISQKFHNFPLSYGFAIPQVGIKIFIDFFLTEHFKI